MPRLKRRPTTGEVHVTDEQDRGAVAAGVAVMGAAAAGNRLAIHCWRLPIQYRR